MYGHDIYERSYRCGEYDGYKGDPACTTFLVHHHLDVRDGYRTGYASGQRLLVAKQHESNSLSLLVDGS